MSVTLRRAKSTKSRRITAARESGVQSSQSEILASEIPFDSQSQVFPEGDTQIGLVDEDEEDEDEDEEDEGDETAVEGELLEDGQFDGTGSFGSPSRRASTIPVPRTPKTPARTRVPQTPGTVRTDSQETPRPKKKKKKPRKTEGVLLAAMTDEQVALAALESNQILHLKLRKKYYAEGLDFIKRVEGSMDILSQLLVSTSKAEVLESMEFFRVAHEYQFESAQVSSAHPSPRPSQRPLDWHQENDSSDLVKR
jgi:condensin complex subunit 1